MKSQTSYSAFILFLTLTVAVLAYAASVQDEETATSPKSPWEHCALTHNSAIVGGDGELSANIIRMGNEGWELVNVSTVVKDGTTVKTIFYFKRPK